jgi:hypothetical protein
MGRAFDTITDQMRSFIADQHVFFVGTAPQNDGNVNLSPKGYDAFRIIDANTVCYLDLTGSGAETIAHIRENGRITFMFCGFEGKPNIVRLYGTGTVVREGDTDWATLSALFPDAPGTRSIISANIHRTSNSCGYAVPFMDFVDDRQQLNNHWEDKTPGDMTEYWAKKNATSIDGLPALP